MNKKEEMGKIILLIIALMIFSACSTTLNLNKAITGTDCQTKEQCIRDLEVDNQPEKSDIVFVVEESEIKGYTKGLLGNRRLGDSNYFINLELCIAKAFRNEFPCSRIIIAKQKTYTTKEIGITNFKNFKITGGIVYDAVTTFSGEVKIPNDNLPIEAKGGYGFLRTTSGCAAKATLNACQDFAKQTRQFLESHGINLDRRQ